MRRGWKREKNEAETTFLSYNSGLGVDIKLAEEMCKQKPQSWKGTLLSSVKGPQQSL